MYNISVGAYIWINVRNGKTKNQCVKMDFVCYWKFNSNGFTNMISSL